MKQSKSLFVAVAVLVLTIAVHRSSGDAVPAATQPTQMDLLVIDGSTQRPLANALVKVDLPTGDDQKLAVRADGHVIVPISRTSDFQYFAVTVQCPGYAGRLLEWRPKVKDPIPSQYTMAMQRGVKIGGRIMDDAGKPVAGAHIVMWLAGSSSTKPHERDFVDADDIVSAADGRWSFADAPADFKTVEVGCWDYEYDNGDSFPMQDLTPAQLRGGSEQYVLQRGVQVTGVIRDAAGKPVAGAEVLTGAQLCSNRVPAQKTDAEGRFHYMAKPGQEVTLTVTHDGYAPELKQFLMGSDKYEMAIQLSNSKPMIGRVVGPKGEPVPYAWIYPDTWRGNRSLTVRIQADKDGKFVWKDAPLDTVYCDVDGSSDGYFREQKVALTASDQEITVTLRHALAVRGSVVDAETNKPIDHFTIIHGISFGPAQPINWEHIPGSAIEGKAGAFDFSLTFAYPGFAVRIEAPGYQPAESRVFTEDEGTVALEFKMKKGADVKATVLRPDGRPAADATAVLALGGQTAYIINCRDINGQGCQQETTGRDGKLDFVPQTGPFKIVIFSADGYAETDREALAKSDTVTLQAWGEIAGVLKVGNKPGAGEQMVVLTKDAEYDAAQPRVFHQIDTKTDVNGKFVFDRVPPGDGVTVAREVMQRTIGGGALGNFTATQKLDMAAGESVQVSLGGMGREVIGHVIIPTELASQENWGFGYSREIRSKSVMPQFPGMPDAVRNGTLEERRKWEVDFYKSDAGKAFVAAEQKAQEAIRTYPLQISQDGVFHADDVAAGTYTLTVDIATKTGASTCGPGDTIATGTAEFTVPDMPGGRSDVPLEIPAVPMQMLKTVNVGDAAPDISVKTLAGNDLKLSGLRGKYVLVDFWATWCGPCIEEVPSIKAVYDAFGKDPRFAMIGISLDQQASDAKGYADKNGLAWSQVYQPGQFQGPIAQAYGVQGIPSVWLIGPDGKVIAKGLAGDGIKAAVQAALGK
jgi:thiol-disulfide isomerase/thioredoxin